MGVLNKAILIVVIVNTIHSNRVNSQNIIFGKWVSTVCISNKVIQIEINEIDSSYIEKRMTCNFKKTIGVYRSKFRIVNDSTIMLWKNSPTYYPSYHRYHLKNGVLKFSSTENKLQESIPLIYTFWFKPLPSLNKKQKGKTE